MNTDDEKVVLRPLSDRLVEPHPSRKPPQSMRLIGRFVQLEPLDPSIHIDELYEASHRDEEARQVWDYLPDGPWSDRAEFLQWLVCTADRPQRIAFAIRSKQTGTAIGMAQYLDIQPQAGVIEIGYIWFAPELQRTRGSTEALFLLLSHAIGELGYRRMQWRCNSLNQRSRAAARRLGFKFEGIFYNHMIVKGKNRDTAWYSILDNEWPSLKDTIETWLMRRSNAVWAR